MRLTALVPIAVLTLVAGCVTKTTSTTTPPKAGPVNFTLDICGTRKIKNPTPEDIQREVYALDTTKNEAFLILGPNDMTYIQTTGDPKNGFIVEYQETDVKHHYRAKRHLTTDETVSTLASYASGSDSWKQTADWEPVTW